jgi:cytochrome c oxidase subunit 2
MGAIVALLFGVIVATGLAYDSHPPSNVETIDSARLHLHPEFAEANLGTRMNADGSGVTVTIVAQQYAFVPNCILVPTDTPVTFRVASGDVIHGFLIQGTNVNTMVVPGYVSTLKAVFPKAAERLMPCHEYCGPGHQAMWARVRIVDRNEFPFGDAKTRSVSCAR